MDVYWCSKDRSLPAHFGASGHRLFPMYLWLLCVLHYVYNVYIYIYIHTYVYMYMVYIYIYLYDICIHISFRLMSTKAALQMPFSTHHGQELSLSPWPKLGDEIVWQQQHRSRRIFWAPKSSDGIFPLSISNHRRGNPRNKRPHVGKGLQRKLQNM